MIVRNVHLEVTAYIRSVHVTTDQFMITGCANNVHMNQLEFTGIANAQEIQLMMKKRIYVMNVHLVGKFYRIQFNSLFISNFFEKYLSLPH